MGLCGRMTTDKHWQERIQKHKRCAKASIRDDGKNRSEQIDIRDNREK